MRVINRLEPPSLPPPRLQAPAPPHLGHGVVADLEMVGQQPGRPVGHPQLLRWCSSVLLQHRHPIHRPRPAWLRVSSSPVTPCSVNRFRHAVTVGRQTPTRSTAICFVPDGESYKNNTNWFRIAVDDHTRGWVPRAAIGGMPALPHC